MDDLRSYVLFNRISFISGRRDVDNETTPTVKKNSPRAGLNLGTPKSAGQRYRGSVSIQEVKMQDPLCVTRISSDPPAQIYRTICIFRYLLAT